MGERERYRAGRKRLERERSEACQRAKDSLREAGSCGGGGGGGKRCRQRAEMKGRRERAYVRSRRWGRHREKRRGGGEKEGQG